MQELTKDKVSVVELIAAGYRRVLSGPKKHGDYEHVQGCLYQRCEYGSFLTNASSFQPVYRPDSHAA